MKEPNFKMTPESAKRFNFSAEDVVDLFLKTTAHWYSDKENTLYGKRARVKRVLLKYLRTKEDTSKDYNESYALMKFSREWMGDGSVPIFVWTEDLK